ncbi:MAG: TRAM domain-containing protein [Actinomycetota bacterium]|nr:TRAM domain-containing protein [Actinomycetota bacterium]MED5393924.1 TRAM domain-containing protein [Actinomycetota bacterium]MEE3353250.1 TRAM domain-containing protein [Actinomycetota bacterium]
MELEVTDTARDGTGIARAKDGRVVFVEGALPGEVVEVAVSREERRWSRARLQRIVQASPHRVEVSCRHRLEGCGGCDLLHVNRDHQAVMKARMVSDQLRRANVAFPETTVHTLVGDAGRTTVKAAVQGGRAGYRVRGSHEVVVPRSCIAIDPTAEELLLDGRFGDATEVTIRVGARTGDRLVVLNGGDPEDVDVPDDVLVVSIEELDAGLRAWVHEEAAGRRWRISARSFFQNRPAAVDALAEVVGSMVADLAPGGESSGPMVDAYAGVGVFAATVGRNWTVTAVERSRDSLADAKVNLQDQVKAGTVRIVPSTVERWRATPAAVVIADPARSGLGRDAAQTLLSCEPDLFVLVGCDHSSFARDASLLAGAGLRLVRLVVADLFPGTSHVEAIGAFVRF